MSALQELGKRILSTSEDMEQQMVDRFQQQIDRLNEKLSRLDYMAHGKPGSEREDNLHDQELEVLSGNAWQLQIGPTNVENSPPLAKPLITPLPYDEKTSQEDYEVQFELIAELT